MKPRGRLREKNEWSKSKTSDATSDNSLSPGRPRSSQLKSESDTEEKNDNSKRKGSDDSKRGGANDASHSRKGQGVPAFLKIFIHPPVEEFNHALLDDKSLNKFVDEINEMKVDLDDEIDEKGKLHKFNASLKKIQEYGVDKQINDRKVTIAGLTALKTNEEKKEKMDALKEIEDKCIADSRTEIDREWLKLVRRTQQELYNQIKDIVVSPTWENQVKKCGGNVILNDQDKKVHVPTGIENMTRILADDVLSFRRKCCRFRFFCPPTPVLRSAASRDVKLTSAEIIQKIIDVKSVAVERLGSGRKKKQLTGDFYHTLSEIDANLLSDFLTLKIYIKKMEQINRNLSIKNFVDENEDPDSTTALKKLTSL